MALPTAHTRRLRQELRIHQRRLEHLRIQLGQLREEAAAHELILRLGTDDAVMRALDEIHADAAVAAQATADPAAFARDRGIVLPDGAQVEVARSNDRTVVAARLHVGPWSCTCIWDSERGFAVRQHPGGGR